MSVIWWKHKQLDLGKTKASPFSGKIQTYPVFSYVDNDDNDDDGGGGEIQPVLVVHQQMSGAGGGEEHLVMTIENIS